VKYLKTTCLGRNGGGVKGGRGLGLKPRALLESMSQKDAICSRRSKGSSDHMDGSIVLGYSAIHFFISRYSMPSNARAAARANVLSRSALLRERLELLKHNPHPLLKRNVVFRARKAFNNAGRSNALPLWWTTNKVIKKLTEQLQRAQNLARLTRQAIQTINKHRAVSIKPNNIKSLNLGKTNKGTYVLVKGPSNLSNRTSPKRSPSVRMRASIFRR